MIFTENNNKKSFADWRFKEVAGQLAVTKQTVEVNRDSVINLQ